MTAENTTETEAKIKDLMTIFLFFLRDFTPNNVSYEELRNKIDQFKQNRNINDTELTLDVIVNYIENSDMKNLFSQLNLPVRKAVDTFVMSTTDTRIIKDAFKLMVYGIDEDNYLDNIYSKISCEKLPFDEEISDIKNLFNQFTYVKKMEMMINLASFVELYYQTPEGKKFIEQFPSKLTDVTRQKTDLAAVIQPDGYVALSIDDLKNTHYYFNELFEKMNKAAFAPMFISNKKGLFEYSFSKESRLNGTFVMFHDNKFIVNMALTTNDSNLVEGVTPVHHGIISKTFADAVYTELKKKVPQNTPETTYFMKKYWDHIISKDEASKNSFLAVALHTVLCEYNIIKTESTVTELMLKNKERWENGQATGTFKELFYQIDSLVLLHKKLGTSGKITGQIMQQFFENTDSFEFRMNYVTVTPD